MFKFTVTQIDEELFATYDNGEKPIIIRRMATGDFIFDCACIIDELSKIIYNKEKEGK